MVKVVVARRLSRHPDRCRARAQMAREARLLRSLAPSPGFPHCLGVAQSAEGAPALLMEAVPGESLASLVQREGRLPVRVAVELMAAISRHLADAQRRVELIHGDLRPHNVLLTPAGRVVIVDLGASCGIGLDREDLTVWLVGGPFYTAPEVMDGQAPAAASDAFSCLLYTSDAADE